MTIEQINDYLFNTYGRDVIHSKPLWRVVWSEDWIERRWETYEDITASGIYLGTKTGWREKKKYWYLTPCYILEKLYTAESDGIKRELGDEGYSYEPMLPFLDADNNRVELNLKIIQFFLHNYYNSDRKIKRDFEKEKEVKEAKAVEHARNVLYESPVADALSYGEGVVVPSNYQKDAVNG